MTLLFTLLVVVGFLLHFLATFPVNYASRIAWGCWLAAAVLWALPAFGAHP
ncbi:MAG: hypothetical protein ACYC8V_09500 [Caulobacteraceae bacterium]